MQAQQAEKPVQIQAQVARQGEFPHGLIPAREVRVGQPQPQMKQAPVRVDAARRKHRGERIPRTAEPAMPMDESVTRRAREMKEAHRA